MLNKMFKYAIVKAKNNANTFNNKIYANNNISTFDV